MNTLQYKGYTGFFSYDEDADIFHGDVQHINDVVTFQGRSIDELKIAFADSVEDYLAFCQVQAKSPEKPYSGRFNVRLSPDLHRRIVREACKSGMSLNAYLAESLTQVLEHRQA